VYDPIVLEGPSISCLIDWGHDDRNVRAMGSVTGGWGPVFHTFAFSVKKVCLFVTQRCLCSKDDFRMPGFIMEQSPGHR